MSITALNAALATLRQLVIAVATETPKATKAVAEYDAITDPRGGDTVGGGGDAHGGDTLSVATGGGGIANSGGGGLPALRTGLRAAGAIVSAAKKEIEKHVADQVQAINGATKDVVQQLIDAVALRDKAQAEVLVYLQGRMNEQHTGNEETLRVINLLKRWKDAQNKGDAAAQAEARRQLEVEFHIINDILIGRGNTKSAGLDLERLLGAGAAGAAQAINATNSATSTGKAP